MQVCVLTAVLGFRGSWLKWQHQNWANIFCVCIILHSLWILEKHLAWKPFLHRLLELSPSSLASEVHGRPRRREKKGGAREGPVWFEPDVQTFVRFTKHTCVCYRIKYVQSPLSLSLSLSLSHTPPLSSWYVHTKSKVGIANVELLGTHLLYSSCSSNVQCEDGLIGWLDWARLISSLAKQDKGHLRKVLSLRWSCGGRTKRN
jgi:hypothetical protein